MVQIISISFLLPFQFSFVCVSTEIFILSHDFYNDCQDQDQWRPQPVPMTSDPPGPTHQTMSQSDRDEENLAAH